MVMVSSDPKKQKRVQAPQLSLSTHSEVLLARRNFLLKRSVSKTTFLRFFQGFSGIRTTQEIPMRRPRMNRIMGAHPGPCTGMHSGVAALGQRPMSWQ